MTAPPGDEHKQNTSDYKECSFRHWPYNPHRLVVLDAPLVLTCTTTVWLRITCYSSDRQILLVGRYREPGPGTMRKDRDLFSLTERAQGQTETVSHRSLDHTHDCHFQSGRPPRTDRDERF